jgi:hypothetical protein
VRAAKALFCASLLGAGLGSCRPADCAAIVDPSERDWCHVEAACQAAAVADLDGALREVSSVSDPLAREVAVDRVLATRPRGMDLARVDQLCGRLAPLDWQKCKDGWYRPHLWRAAG